MSTALVQIGNDSNAVLDSTSRHTQVLPVRTLVHYVQESHEIRLRFFLD